MTRSELKSLVKECLLEILNEGLGGVSLSQSPLAASLSNRPSYPQRSISSSLRQESRKTTPALREAVRRESGGDKVMESILADTARTTLATQIAHGDTSTPSPGASSGRGIVQQEQVNGSPEQIFGEDVASKWASLAFMDSPTKK